MKNVNHLLQVTILAGLLPLIAPTLSAATEPSTTTAMTVAEPPLGSAESADDGISSPDPQSHFTAAMDALTKKHYKEAATEIRKAEASLVLEARRSSRELRPSLEQARAELESLARALDDGTEHAGSVMAQAFAKAEHTLALSHRGNAARALSSKSLRLAGAELGSAAQGLKSGAQWAGTELDAAAARADDGSKTVADKLATGAHWTAHEVAMAFQTLGSALDQLGTKIGSHLKAQPLHEAG